MSRTEDPDNGVNPSLEGTESHVVAIAPPGGVWARVRYGEGAVKINEGRPVTTLRVTNTGDRPVTVGSHYHFAEANDALEFDRGAAWGKRLNVVSGGLRRFDPGKLEEVELVPFVGNRIAAGFRGLCGGRLDG